MTGYTIAMTILTAIMFACFAGGMAALIIDRFAIELGAAVLVGGLVTAVLLAYQPFDSTEKSKPVGPSNQQQCTDRGEKLGTFLSLAIRRRSW